MTFEEIVFFLVLIGCGTIVGGFSGAIAAKNARGFWSAWGRPVCIAVVAPLIFCFTAGFFDLPLSQGIRITHRIAAAFAGMLLYGLIMSLFTGGASVISSTASYMIFSLCIHRTNRADSRPDS